MPGSPCQWIERRSGATDWRRGSVRSVSIGQCSLRRSVGFEWQNRSSLCKALCSRALRGPLARRKKASFAGAKHSAARYLALPNPKLAPYGAAAQQALEYAGLWGMVQSKVVYGENVRQALQLVESGNADVVITSDSLLRGKDADLIPADWHKPIVQKAGVVSASQNREGAQLFLEFLLSPAGQGILARYGFGKP